MAGLGMKQKITPVRGVGYRLEDEVGSKNDPGENPGQDADLGNEEESG